jgi:uncharacterized membrane protein YphA (DoxX/SURF4 family)
MKTVWKIIKNIVTSEYLALVLRLVIGILFIYSAMPKIPYPAEFAKNVEAYQIVPFWAINIFAVFLPWLELTCGMFLVVGLATRACAFVLAIMLGSFALALLINVLRGSPITCGCFETTGEQIGWFNVFRDVALMLLTLQIAFFSRIFVLLRGGLLTGRKRKNN